MCIYEEDKWLGFMCFNMVFINWVIDNFWLIVLIILINIIFRGVQINISGLYFEYNALLVEIRDASMCFHHHECTFQQHYMIIIVVHGYYVHFNFNYGINGAVIKK